MEKGFTLIESLVVIVVFSLSLLAVTELILGLYRAHNFTFQQLLAIEEARNGIDLMIKEIREARPGDDGSYPIEQAQDYEFVFFADIDRDGDTERVRYFVDGSDFKKGVIDPVGSPPRYITDPQDPQYSEKIFILSKYIRNQPPIFHYYDKNLSELPPPARLKDTKLMKVVLVINVDPNRPPEDFVLESEVRLRNLND